MLLLGIDIETNADDSNEFITEIGAILYDWNTKQPVLLFSELFVPTEASPLSSDVVELTGITDNMLTAFAYKVGEDDIKDYIVATCFPKLSEMFRQADYVVAHNGNKFDKPRLEKFAENYGLDMYSKPWIDTLTDVEYPKHCKSKNMTYLCGYHGFVNPFSHRALFDVAAMMKVLERYPIERVIEVSKSPMIKLIAHVSFHNKQLAKDAGFYWDGEKKVWYKEIKEILLEGLEFPFSTERREM